MKIRKEKKHCSPSQQIQFFFFWFFLLAVSAASRGFVSTRRWIEGTLGEKTVETEFISVSAPCSLFII